MIWDALVLAAGRGPGDPMARAFGVTHKCLLPVAGVPMLTWVVMALRAGPAIDRIVIAIEDGAPLPPGLGDVKRIASKPMAAESAIFAATSGAVRYPLLVTTGDHPLLTAEMLAHFIGEAERMKADLCAGLARDKVILAAYPDTRRTFLAFGPDRVSGCNLFALKTPLALKALEKWRFLETVRKKPWRLFGAFGVTALARFLTGRLSLDQAFEIASRQLGLTARPILMPFAEAAIDVDKPEDKVLAEEILRKRTQRASASP